MNSVSPNPASSSGNNSNWFPQLQKKNRIEYYKTYFFTAQMIIWHIINSFFSFVHVGIFQGDLCRMYTKQVLKLAFYMKKGQDFPENLHLIAHLSFHYDR